MDQQTAKLFSEVVGEVQLGCDTFGLDEVPFDPLTEDVVFEAHVADAACRLFQIPPSRTCIIILIRDQGRALWDTQVPHHTPYKEEPLSSVSGFNEFCHCRRV